LETGGVARVLIINPNCSADCSVGIDAAVAQFRFTGGPALEVVTLAEGPKAIYSWRDWHAVVEPLCRFVSRQDADAYVIACASDPGLEAVRAVTPRPVLGVFRCAVAAALTRAERFGVIAIVEASKARHLLAVRSMGVAERLAGEVALNVTMEALLDTDRTRAALIAAAGELAAAGAGAIVLGCTGMAHHRAVIAEAVGLPLIEPCQAGALAAIGAVGSPLPRAGSSREADRRGV
jgi:allantoin racemase